MSDLSLQIVREYFELNFFHVLTHWQHEDTSPRLADAASLLFVERAAPEMPGEPPFLLRADDLSQLARAMVEVRAWHADKVYASTVETNPVLGHVATSEAQGLATAVFGGAAYRTVLIISELPLGAAPRERALDALRILGVGHVIEFPTILQDMLLRISAHGNYAPSPTLQMLRLLKRYNFIRRQQLEFAFAVEPPPTAAPAVFVTTAPDPDEEAE